MGFSDEDRILMENLYVLKWYNLKQEKLIKEFSNKGRDCVGWTNFWKSCKKLVRRQDIVAALKAYRIFRFLFCNIRTRTGYYKKGKCLWLQMFSAAISPLLLEMVNIWPSNHKKEKGLTFLRHSVSCMRTNTTGNVLQYQPNLIQCWTSQRSNIDKLHT